MKRLLDAFWLWVSLIVVLSGGYLFIQKPDFPWMLLFAAGIVFSVIEFRQWSDRLKFVNAMVIADTKKNGDQKSFLEEFSEIILSVDIDTSRFIEYIWGRRVKHGLDTGNYVANLVGTENLKMEAFSGLFQHKYNMVCQFDSIQCWRGILFEDNYPGVPRLVVSVVHYNKSEPYSIVLIGDRDLVKEWETYFVDTFTPPSLKTVQTLLGVTRDNKLRVQDRVIHENAMEVGFDEFYPFIEGGIKALAKSFDEGKEAVLFLKGMRGTGKTTLIRTLMLQMNRLNFGICSDATVLEHPEMIGWMTGLGDDAVSAIEDADRFVSAREDGNKQMSALLNLADGILSSKRKIIISTNLATMNKVDDALTRPGRTFDTIEFRKLTIPEANRARSRVNLPELPETIGVSEITLSEALNYDRINNVHTKAEKIVGFVKQ